MSINNCGCTQTNPCGQPTCQETSCACDVYINSDCVNDVKAEFTCLPIESHLTLTQTLEEMDSAICNKFDEFDSHFQLTNTGTGAESYKGVNLLGQKEIRKINAVGDLITVTQNTNDISVSIDETELTAFVEDLIPSPTGVCIESSDESVTVREVDGCFDLTVTPTDGSETKINAGTNVTITGNGTTATPYVINSATPNGSETKINSGTTTNVSGVGTIASPYIVETKNLQRVETSSFTLSNTDNNYDIFINNSSTPINITIPSGLQSGLVVSFIQQGTGDITFVSGVGVTIRNPIGNVIKGQDYWAHLIQVGATNEYHLLGSTKV